MNDLYFTAKNKKRREGSLTRAIFAHKIARKRQSLFGQKCAPDSRMRAFERQVKFHVSYKTNKERIYPLLICLVRETGIEPVRSPTRPSNVRVCLFRHSRIAVLINTTLILYTIFRKCQYLF